MALACLLPRHILLAAGVVLAEVSIALTQAGKIPAWGVAIPLLYVDFLILCWKPLRLQQVLVRLVEVGM